MRSRWWWTRWLAAVAVMVAGATPGYSSDTGSPNRLRANYEDLREKLGNNPFGKPFHVNSSESADGVKGEIHAVLNHPFAKAAATLRNAKDWCEILILPINTKQCRASTGDQASVLDVRIGRKHDQAVEDAYQVEFKHQVAASTADYLQVRLGARDGPFGTRDYRMVLEAIPLGEQTFLHLSYAYGFGTAGRLAAQAYLATSGRDKVGFTVAGTQPDGQPRYVGGMRGMVERNTMRYYLAIEAFLGSLSAPPGERLEKRLHDWFAATERYPRQLHEMEQTPYVTMKRREYARQQTG